MITSYISQLDEPTLDDFIKVIENEKPNTIVLLCETEWHVRELTPELANLLNSHNIKLMVTVCSHPSDYYKTLTQHFNNIEIVHWPTYWVNWTMMCGNFLNFNQTYHGFKYPYICLNNKNHVHRCMLVDELTGQGILDQGIVTWNKFPMREHNPYPFKYYDDSIRLLSDDFETKLDSFLIPEEYHQSFLHVIGEATTSVTCISEKTWLPILFKKPFIIMADQYFHKKLVDLGFELYDEIIDYSFDSEPDMLKRAEAIAVNVKRITEQNTSELYQKIKAKAQRNYENYIRILTSIEYMPQVIIDRVHMLRNDPSVVRNATDGRYLTLYDDITTVDLDIWDNDLEQKLSIIYHNPEKVSKIIFNGVLEFDSAMIHGSSEKFQELVDFCKKHKIELLLLTGTHNHYQITNDSYVKVDYWPTFWLTLTLTRLLVSPNYHMNNSICLDIQNIRVGEHTPIKYPYISMNKAPKHHRALLMDKLAKHDIIDKGVVIWRELNNTYPFEYWNQEIMLRDQKEKFVYQETLPMEYALSFMQLVPETTDMIFGLSEKASMPLLFNKPFLVAGSTHYHRKLQDMGFKLYDELFDYSFDDVLDVNLRFEMIAENVKRYTNKSVKELQELYDSVFEKCVYNKQMALHIATDPALVPGSWRELSKHNLYHNKVGYPETINDFIKHNVQKYRFKEV